VSPETVKSYEAGIKSNEFANLSFNLAGFYNDYRNVQESTQIEVNGVPQILVANAASARIYGAEFNGSWQATEAFSITGGLTYLHARYRSFPSAVVTIPTGVGGSVQTAVNMNGQPLVRSPDWSGNLTARYVTDTSVGTFDASSTLFYSSKFYIDVGDRVAQTAYALVNARLAFRPKGTALEIGVWGKNLSNKPVLFSQAFSTFADPVNYSPPLTFGADATYKF
jgi:iron complex outermembrane recepter protein